MAVCSGVLARSARMVLWDRVDHWGPGALWDPMAHSGPTDRLGGRFGVGGRFHRRQQCPQQARHNRVPVHPTRLRHRRRRRANRRERKRARRGLHLITQVRTIQIQTTRMQIMEHQRVSQAALRRHKIFTICIAGRRNNGVSGSATCAPGSTVGIRTPTTTGNHSRTGRPARLIQTRQATRPAAHPMHLRLTIRMTHSSTTR